MGEMTHAKELLSVLLSSPPPGNIPAHSLPPGTLSLTTVSRLPDIPSLQVFNSQLASVVVIGENSELGGINVEVVGRGHPLPEICLFGRHPEA